MRYFRFILAIVLLSALVLAPVCHAEYYGCIPTDEIYMKQTRQHTCTLIAASMMVRAFAQQNDLDVERLTEAAMDSAAWFDGLIWDFTIDTINVQCVQEIGQGRQKKENLILFLKWHPEGLVIYDADMPHAIYLAGYDQDTDTFYCADTTTARAGKLITLPESLLHGETQEDVIATIDRIWYVTGYKNLPI